MPNTTEAIENQSTPHVTGLSFGGKSNKRVSLSIKNSY